MLENFNRYKNQLSDLSAVLNKFKSEAVQLKILELLFLDRKLNVVEATHSVTSSEQKSKVTTPKPSKSQRKKPVKKLGNSSANSTKSRKNGPKTVLGQLADSGYFNSKKSINEIKLYCKDSLARNFKTTDLSPALSRLIKDQTLAREKNSESGQYEYFTR